MIVVQITYACDICKRTVTFTEEGFLYSEYMPKDIDGWETVDEYIVEYLIYNGYPNITKWKDVYACPECMEKHRALTRKIEQDNEKDA